MEYRIERDSMGEIKVPADKLWGAQTQRSFENFKIGTEKIPPEMVTVFAYLKKAAALTNKELGVVDGDRADAIVQACDDILAGKLDGNFPLAVWMTGSGTQFNMNVNEVVANRAKQILQAQGKDLNVHPNDHVNHSQSSNDTFPTGLHMVGVLLIEEKLFPAMEALYQALRAKQEAFKDIVKIGRTHLQDATPLTLGQDGSARPGYAGPGRRFPPRPGHGRHGRRHGHQLPERLRCALCRNRQPADGHDLPYGAEQVPFPDQ